jgi:hypothetical protein
MEDQPDSLGNSIRFGCGAIFGAATGYAAFLWFLPSEWYVTAIAATGVALLFGFLAIRWGDAFWTWVVEHREWFR